MCSHYYNNIITNKDNDGTYKTGQYLRVNMKMLQANTYIYDRLSCYQSLHSEYNYRLQRFTK